jgi:hypothetical protein
VSAFEELTPEEIAETIAEPVKRTRTKKEVVLERTNTGWFALTHERIVACENPDCIDPRPKGKYPTLKVYRMPDGVAVCRYCYLGGYGE